MGPETCVVTCEVGGEGGREGPLDWTGILFYINNTELAGWVTVTRDKEAGDNNSLGRG